jgi:hypothetical protein
LFRKTATESKIIAANSTFPQTFRIKGFSDKISLKPFFQQKIYAETFIGISVRCLFVRFLSRAKFAADRIADA